MSIHRFVLWFVLAVFGWLFPQLARGDDALPPPEVAPRAPEVTPAAPPASCLQFAGDAGLAAEAVGALKFAIGDAAQPLAELRIDGLSTLALDDVWQLVGGRPAGPFGVEQAAALIGRLAQSGLFARIAPTVRLSPDDGGGAVLDIAVVEHATVRAIDVRGLVELTRDEILDALLVVPDDDADDDTSVGVGRHLRARNAVLALRCAAPVPPKAWLAGHVHDAVRPGLVWRGIRGGLDRVQRYLRREGYLLAQAAATLTPDGTLAIAIDEGRLDAVTVDGVHPELRADVQRLLGAAPGAILNLTDLHQGVDRVKARYPFLSTSARRHRAPPLLAIAEQVAADGTVQFTLRPGPARCEPDRDDRWFTWADLDDDRADDCASTTGWYELDGRHLAVHFAADRADTDADGTELVRHTPVTGFAPGLRLTVRAWDPADRAHVRLDTLFNVNTSRANVAARTTGTLGQLAAAERIDFMVAPSLSIPRYGLAELGGAAYTLTDTDDAFRVTRLDSYLNSGLFGRPERDYYRRTGASGFATFHWFDQLTFGGEYRYDRHGSLTTASDPDTIFGDYIPATPAIDDGKAGAVVLRVEWASDKASIDHVDANRDRRPSQGSIVDRRSAYRATNCLRSVATLELADPSLGGAMRYWRAVSDSILSLTTGHDQGVSLRFRVGGGSDLPVQRQEALGGWGTLRGYDFKELAGGDLSALMNLEYRFDAVSAFVDAGTLRAPGVASQQVRLGVGAALNLGDSGQLAVAWRTDDQAEATPQIRLLFGRPW